MPHFSKSMRIILFANGKAGVAVLNRLSRDGHTILVVCPPGGRYREWHDSVSDECSRLGIEFLEPINPCTRPLLEKYSQFSPDLILSILYHIILSDEVLEIAEYCINIHPSLLPSYRGTAPLIWAIVEGETETGVTAHEMTNRVDSGNYYGQRVIEIGPHETGFELHNRAAMEIDTLAREIVHKIEIGSLGIITPEAREESLYTSKTPYVNALDPENQSCKKICDIVRALASPLTNAWYEAPDGRWTIESVNRVNDYLGKKITNLCNEGEFHAIGDNGEKFLIATDGVLRVEIA